MSLRIYNSLSRQLETFESLEPGKVRMYVCGMTIYDLCHIGHARFMMAFDVVYRWLVASGYEVTYVRNITDIDDKIIVRALERQIPIRQLTDEMTQAMHEDIAALGILPPTLEPRATEHVPQMLSMIAQLEANGLAYRSTSGDVNFAVRKFPGYGKLSGKSLDQLRAGERVAVMQDKLDPMDFVLWKAAKPSEPADAKWDSPFGPGRPGWHIECSAMGCHLLGKTFDIHGGGVDLQFPHHENEIAQSEGANGVPFVNYWLHNGHLNVDNEKMSKSLGNFFTIRDVLKRFDGETMRCFMLRTHYRSPFNFSDTFIEDTRSALRRLYTALAKAGVSGEISGSSAATQAAALDASIPAVQRFKEAMDEDFNTPAALAVLFDLASDLNREPSAQTAQCLRSLGGVLGLLQQDPQRWLQAGAGEESPDEAANIQKLIDERAQAKSERQWQRADEIRKLLLEQGIELQDGPAGTTWVRR